MRSAIDLNPPLRYGIAVFAPLLAYGVRILLNPILHDKAPLQIFTLAVVVAAWLGGLGPGLASTVIGGALGLFRFISVDYSMVIPDSAEFTHLIIHFVNGIAISLIAESMRRATIRERQQRDASSESELRFRAIFNQSSGFLGIIDLQGIFRDGNEAPFIAAGMHREEEIGRQFWETSWWNKSEDVQKTVRSNIERALAGEAIRWESPYFLADGMQRWVDAVLTPIRNAQGKLAFVVAEGRDITRQRQAQVAIRDSEDQLRHVLDTLSAFVGLLAPDGTLLETNRAPLETSGIKIEEVRGKKFWECPWWTHSPETQQKLKSAIERAAESGEVARFDIEAKMGEACIWIDFMLAPLRDAAGKITHLVPSGIDLTARKHAEEALRQSEERLSAVFRQAGAGIAQTDLKGRYLMVNDQYCRITSRSREELLALRIQDITAPGDRSQMEDQFEELARTGRSYVIEKRYTRPDESNVWVRKSIVAIRDAHGVVESALAVAQDITERKRVEVALQAREAQLRLVTDHATVFLAQCDRQHRYKFVNRPYAQRFNMDAQEIIGRYVWDVVGKQAFGALEPYLDAVLGGQQVEFETEIPYPTVGSRWMNVVYIPERSSEGKIVGHVAVITDISQRKKAEVELARSEAFLQSIISANADCIAVLDLQGRLQWMSETGQSLMGIEDFKLVHNQGWHELWSGVDQTQASAAVRNAIYGGVGRFRGSSPVATRAQKWWDVIVTPIPGIDGTPDRLLCVARDISDQRRVEEDLERARDEALAASRAKDEFLAALSHELRTPLNPVLMLASEQERSPDLSPELREDFAMIRKNVELEARLIDDLLDLTRIARGKLQLKIEVCDARSVLKQAVEIIKLELVAKSLRLDLEMEAPLHHVWADAVRLHQVFWNILKNAVKFTQPGGKIVVKTRESDDGSTLHLDFIDSGIGITPDEMPRIFNAFDQGDHARSRRFGGLGLGLAICRLLMELHQGRIWAESTGRDCGTIFHIEIPLAARESTPKADLEPELPLPAPTIRRLLLVEDHDNTRTVLVRLLTKRGFEVSEAGTVTQARQLAENGDFDFVVSDLGLPDGDGQDLMRELKKNYGLRGIALSGFGMDEDIQRSLDAGFIAHLTKPVDIESLVRTLSTTA